jgi:hypothetical protein
MQGPLKKQKRKRTKKNNKNGWRRPARLRQGAPCGQRATASCHGPRQPMVAGRATAPD